MSTLPPTEAHSTPNPGARSTAGAPPVPTAAGGTGPTTLAEGPAWPRLSGHPSVPGHEIESILGRGGMGVVYKARQTALGRTVALKMILPDAAVGDAELQRFRLEAEAVAKLQHPNIVQIHEIGEVDGRPYFTLEYVPGGSLHHAVKNQPQPPQSAAALVATIARAVDACHRRGIIHRDLKPANVLLQDPTTPKIADFGLARSLDSELTKTGPVLGTPAYMAPEQAAGRVKEIGPACDIWALGAILYHLLTGRPPFLGATAYETVELVLRTDPPPPRRLTPKVPADLETICLKALEKQPSRRYATAAAMADDLDRFLKNEPIHARPVGSVERAVRWSQRHPAIAGLLLALALVVTTSIVVLSRALIQVSRESAAKDDALKAVQLEQRTTANALWHIIFDVSDGIEKLPAARELRMKLLRTSLTRALALDPDAELMEDVHHSRVGAHSRLSDIFREVGDTAQCRKHVEAALAYAQRLASEKPDEPHYQEEVFVHHAKLGDVLLAQGQIAEPKRYYDLALTYAEIKEGKKPKQHLHQLCHLLRRQTTWALEAQDWQAANLLATRLLEPARAAPFPSFESLAHRLRGEALLKLGNHKEARNEFEAAIVVARGSRLRTDATEEDRRVLGEALSRGGDVALQLGHAIQADLFFQEALKVLLDGAAPLGTDLPRDLIWVATQERLAALALVRDQVPAALELLNGAETWRRQWASDRTHLMRQVELARCLAAKAKTLENMNDPAAPQARQEANRFWQELAATGILKERPWLSRPWSGSTRSCSR